MPCPARDLDKICKADGAHCGDSVWNRPDYQKCPSYWRWEALPEKQKLKLKAKGVNRTPGERKLAPLTETPELAPNYRRGDGSKVS